MRNLLLGRTLTIGALSTLLLGASLLPRTVAGQHSTQASRLTAQATSGPASSPAGALTTSQSDQTDLSLTVYNSDLALVRDTREITLPTGELSAQVHGRRRDFEPCYRAFPVARRPGKPERAGAKL